MKNTSLDIDQDVVAHDLLQEHKDGEGKWPTEFNGKKYQFQDNKSRLYWATDIKVEKLKRRNIQGFICDISSTHCFDYLLVYHPPYTNGWHCVYVTNYDAVTNKIHCMNSYGNRNETPTVDLDQEGNKIYRVTCTSTRMYPKTKPLPYAPKSQTTWFV